MNNDKRLDYLRSINEANFTRDSTRYIKRYRWR